MYDNRPRKITAAMDLLAGYDLPEASINDILPEVVDVLCGYPKPERKSDTIGATPQALAAYLLVSNARNAAKLGRLGFFAPFDACKIAVVNLELALSLLVD